MHEEKLLYNNFDQEFLINYTLRSSQQYIKICRALTLLQRELFLSGFLLINNF